MKKCSLEWTIECETAFCEVKRKLTDAPVLAYFDPKKELCLQVDSSKNGGAFLTQERQPHEYTSRSLRPAERNWAQIEKEAPAVLYGLERFDQYTYGRKVIIENDPKRLETILRKPFSQARKRLQDILMKLYRYDTEFHFVKGVDLVLGDMLSGNFENSEQEELTRTRIFGVNIVEHFPDTTLEEVRKATAKDESLQLLIKVILNGWQEEKENVDTEIQPYFSMRDSLSHEE